MEACEATTLRAPSSSLDALELQITELAAHIHAANYRLLCLIAEFDRRKGWKQWGVLSCAHWLNWKCGVGLIAAREKVRVARSLESFPRISEAFRTGQLSYSKVRAMTRVATTENEGYLLDIDARTCVTLWDGTIMDHALAVENLLAKDGALQLEFGARYPAHFPRHQQDE